MGALFKGARAPLKGFGFMFGVLLKGLEASCVRIQSTQREGTCESGFYILLTCHHGVKRVDTLCLGTWTLRVSL